MYLLPAVGMCWPNAPITEEIIGDYMARTDICDESRENSDLRDRE
jgi:hypothetical protein